MSTWRIYSDQQCCEYHNHRKKLHSLRCIELHSNPVTPYNNRPWAEDRILWCSVMCNNSFPLKEDLWRPCPAAHFHEACSSNFLSQRPKCFKEDSLVGVKENRCGKGGEMCREERAFAWSKARWRRSYLLPWAKHTLCLYLHGLAIRQDEHEWCGHSGCWELWSLWVWDVTPCCRPFRPQGKALAPPLGRGKSWASQLQGQPGKSFCLVLSHVISLVMLCTLAEPGKGL